MGARIAQTDRRAGDPRAHSSTIGVGGDQNPPPTPRPAGWGLEHHEGLQDLGRPLLIRTVLSGERQTREPNKDLHQQTHLSNF